MCVSTVKWREISSGVAVHGVSIKVGDGVFSELF